MMSGRPALDMNALNDVRPSSTRHENKGRPQIQLPEIKAGRPALATVSVWRVTAKANNLEVMVLLGCGLRFGMQLLELDFLWGSKAHALFCGKPVQRALQNKAF
jgi:hypothetical protein